MHTSPVQLSAVILLSLFAAAAAPTQKFEGLAKTPPMGWNSWNTFETNISEELVQDVARAMIDSGMQASGYTYIVLDDGWMSRERDRKGDLVPHPEKFPGGMKALAEHLHKNGFNFGLYNCAGSLTCAGYPGSQGNEFQDTRLYAESSAHFSSGGGKPGASPLAWLS